MSQFYISDSNPNTEVGGGGCIGQGETRQEDCVGPYVIFPAVSTDSNVSPHVVLCSRCLSELGAAPEEEPAIDIPAEDIEEIPEV